MRPERAELCERVRKPSANGRECRKHRGALREVEIGYFRQILTLKTTPQQPSDQLLEFLEPGGVQSCDEERSWVAAANILKCVSDLTHHVCAQRRSRRVSWHAGSRCVACIFDQISSRERQLRKILLRTTKKPARNTALLHLTSLLQKPQTDRITLPAQLLQRRACVTALFGLQREQKWKSLTHQTRLRWRPRGAQQLVQLALKTLRRVRQVIQQLKVLQRRRVQKWVITTLLTTTKLRVQRTRVAQQLCKWRVLHLRQRGLHVLQQRHALQQRPAFLHLRCIIYNNTSLFTIPQLRADELNYVALSLHALAQLHQAAAQHLELAPGRRLNRLLQEQLASHQHLLVRLGLRLRVAQTILAPLRVILVVLATLCTALEVLAVLGRIRSDLTTLTNVLIALDIIGNTLTVLPTLANFLIILATLTNILVVLTTLTYILVVLAAFFVRRCLALIFSWKFRLFETWTNQILGNAQELLGVIDINQ